MKDIMLHILIHQIANDLETASGRLEHVEFELLGHKNGLADAFSGTLTAYDQILTHIAEQLHTVAGDVEKGLAGGSHAVKEDGRVKELADKLRAIECGTCEKNALECRCDEEPDGR